MEKQQKQSKIKVVRRKRTTIDKGADIKEFCGVLKLKEDPMAIQKQLRNEWQ